MTRPDLTGKRFGKLVVLKDAGKARWTCQCDCGREAIVIHSNLTFNHTRSCGCLRKGNEIRSKHGMSGTVIHKTWLKMIERCYHPKCFAYKDYGERGILVCEFLRASPANILHVIGERPPKLSFDRIDNNLGYHCGACAECRSKNYALNIRWATRKQQQNNTRRNRFLTFMGETKTVSQWAEIVGIDDWRLRWRDDRGLDPFKEHNGKLL